MQKIVFLENRDKTLFWRALAPSLSTFGYESLFIVQNHAYGRQTSSHFNIPYPSQQEMDKASPVLLDKVAVSDRNILYFGGNARHYGYYARLLYDFLESVRPVAVIGECTLFHELIAVECCRALHIPFLHPTATRYPNGHFSVYAMDSSEAICGSSEVPDDDTLAAMVSAIGQRRTKPSYMERRPSLTEIKFRLRQGRERARVYGAWIRGERFNTPSLTKKLELDASVGKNRRRWEALAATRRGAHVAPVLYPLQMEPESNLNVWGRPWGNQSGLLRRLLDAMPDVAITVKLNPKAKYELNDQLLDLVDRESRLVPLPAETTMSDALKGIRMVTTVTGTIGFEAIFSGIPSASLGHPIVHQKFPEFAVRNVSEISRSSAFAGRQQAPSTLARVDLLRAFFSESYAGLISDPVTDPECTESSNTEKVSRALIDVLSRISADEALANRIVRATPENITNGMAMPPLR